MSPRRTARPRARRKIDGIHWINLKITLAGGFGTPLELARLWHEYAEHVLAEGTPGPDHWCYAVLELGGDPPFEPDARLSADDPAHAEAEARDRENADLAREHYAELKGAKP